MAGPFKFAVPPLTEHGLPQKLEITIRWPDKVIDTHTVEFMSDGTGISPWIVAVVHGAKCQIGLDGSGIEVWIPENGIEKAVRPGPRLV